MWASKPTRSRCCAPRKCYVLTNSVETLLMASFGMMWETKKCTQKSCLRWACSRNTAWVWQRKWLENRRWKSWIVSSALRADSCLKMNTRIYKRNERRIRPCIRTYSPTQWKSISSSRLLSRCIIMQTSHSNKISTQDHISDSTKSAKSRERWLCLFFQRLKVRYLA